MKYRTVSLLALACISFGNEIANAQIVTWVGAGDGSSYSDPLNWSSGELPLNSVGQNFNVVVPNGWNVVFDIEGQINGLSFGQGGSITVEPGVSFSVNSVASINSNIRVDGADASFAADGVGVALGDSVRVGAYSGGNVVVAATEYRWSSEGTQNAFVAHGEGSVIVAPELISISNVAPPTNPFETRFIADDGGLLDFSNVSVIDGGIRGFNGRFTSNVFTMTNGGHIDFSNLAVIEELNRFELDVPGYELPSLTSVGGTAFSLSVGTAFDTPLLTTVAGSGGSSVTIPDTASWNAPQLDTLNDTSVSLSVGGSLNAPLLSEFKNSSVRLEPGVVFNVGNLTNVDNSRIAVLGGEELVIAAKNLRSSREASSTVFHADGAGSRIAASNVSSIENVIPPTSTFLTSFIAENGGTLDLSGVTTLDGGRAGFNGRFTSNVFRAANGGEIFFGDLVTSQFNHLDIDGSNSQMSFQSLRMGSGTSVSVTDLGTLNSEGSFVHYQTQESSLDVDNGRVAFRNAEVAELEVAGRDLGTATNGLANFGFQQLAIGTSGNPSRIVLTDKVDNGNRDGANETQYLLDVNGQGLVLNGGSSVVLNGLDMYVSNGADSFFSIRSLFAPGEEIVTFGDGFVSLTAERGTILNGSFESGSLLGFEVGGDGVAEIVSSPVEPDDSVLRMIAGSPVEVTQFVTLPNEEFGVSVDVLPEQQSGVLEVWLADQLVAAWDASALSLDEFTMAEASVSEVGLLGGTDIPLMLRWDGASGDAILINDLRFIVPEPSLGLGVVLLFGLACRGLRFSTTHQDSCQSK